jgi:tetratricopeptide (TPR) repeat protein
MIIAGLIQAPSPLRAQPAGAPPGDPSTPTGNEPGPDDDEPVVIDDPDKPWTQGVSAEDRQAARELFLEGNRRFRIPLFAKAAEKYAAALARWKHPAFYFNLAVAQLNLGEDVEARENLERALEYGEEPLGAEQFQEAQRQLREVERQLGRIRVSCPTQGAEVTLDGVKLLTGPGSYEGWAKATPHEITAKKAGYLSEARQVAVTSGQLLEVELKLITLSEATDASRRWAG